MVKANRGYADFNNCAKISENDTWRVFFENCAMGELPEGYQWVARTRQLTYTDEDGYDHVHEIAKSTKEALRQFIAIFSKEACEEDPHNLQVTSMSMARGPNFGILIEGYISKQRQAHNLNQTQILSLTLAISQLKLTGRLNDSTIVFADSKISEIKSIIIDESGSVYVC